ncbi:SagB/ThcOx family dehydrogenase [Bradyrhizobium erythrophlei]|uniref:SagB-type dehydrogenase domain-containing protein n=1 Tax=Bradyrhizobium erythrophlei TaxID=1437360 RepID=A0A1M7UVU9_9BRAD|nr:SagB family peptide dehydrogenase [Bradyrhizobium erythrophlei]SHN87036.1 SagB-type dehydrogenase domain-containing protein [Bradyrhizobium erythrophlei]
MATPKKKASGRKTATPVLTAHVVKHVVLEAQADGNVVVRFEGYTQGLGKFAPAISKRIAELRTGLPLASIASSRAADTEINLLVRRLARSGLLEYRLGPARCGQASVVIEPQIADYRPQISKVANTDTIALSRFAYLRRRGKEMVLESPRASALFRIADPKIAAALAALSQPQKIGQYRKERDFPGLEVLGLLVDCQILFKLKAADIDGARPSEGDPNLVLWDFHDLLFHTRSTEGRQANPLGGLYTYSRLMTPLPAVRPPWPGQAIELNSPGSPPPSPFAALLNARQSVRDFDDEHPITLAELGAFLQSAGRVRGKWTAPADIEDGQGPDVSYASRPYPSAGAAYELELYLAVHKCEGLSRGFYHYDADRHALTPIEARPADLEAQLYDAEFAIGASNAPQVLIVIAARFGRVTWKYSSVAYSLILKDVGVLTQTLYLAATDLGLGGCAIGTNNIDRFARMTGLDFAIEGPVGQFALGRAAGRRPDGDSFEPK